MRYTESLDCFISLSSIVLTERGNYLVCFVEEILVLALSSPTSTIDTSNQLFRCEAFDQEKSFTSVFRACRLLWGFSQGTLFHCRCRFRIFFAKGFIRKCSSG